MELTPKGEATTRCYNTVTACVCSCDAFDAKLLIIITKGHGNYILAGFCGNLTP